MAAHHTTHGQSGRGRRTLTYQTWSSLRNRCQNPRNASYADYGGRGIAVDPAWDDFATFLSDMGEKPAGMSIDRIDNSKGYGPGNCRWATRDEQSRNRRNTRWVTIGPFRLTMSEWALVFQVSQPTATKRITMLGWNPEEAVSTPPTVRVKDPSNDGRRGNRRPRPRMTAKEFRAHQAARLATRAGVLGRP